MFHGQTKEAYETLEYRSTSRKRNLQVKAQDIDYFNLQQMLTQSFHYRNNIVMLGLKIYQGRQKIPFSFGFQDRGEASQPN